MLPDRTGLGAFAAVVSEDASARATSRRMAALAQGLDRGCPARDSRSPRPEVLPQPVYLPVGRGGRPVSMEGATPLCAVGIGRTCN